MRISKITVLSLVLLSLVGCGKGDNIVQQGYYNKGDFTEQCLDGIVYYARVIAGKGLMSVKINKETLLPETCQEINNEYK